MKRYNNVEEIKPHFTSLKPISQAEVFQFYKYTTEEYIKWTKTSEKSDIKKANDNFDHYEEIFRKREWFCGSIKIPSLYSVTMCIGPPFLNRLACSKVDCTKFYNEDCSCSDSEKPTLEKVILNFNLNSHTKVAKDIIGKLNEKGKIEDLTIIIMRDEEPPNLPHVIDGNHRLIAMGISPCMSNNFINCYIGG